MKSEIIPDHPSNTIINTADEKASVALYARDGKIWLNQQQMLRDLLKLNSDYEERGNYYQICHRKLWLHANGINMEYTSKGKVLVALYAAI